MLAIRAALLLSPVLGTRLSGRLLSFCTMNYVAAAATMTCNKQLSSVVPQLHFDSSRAAHQMCSLRRFATIERGHRYSVEYRQYFRNAEGEVISPWHDIPLSTAPSESSASAALNVGSVFNMVVEIPRWSNAKMEIAKHEVFNPIMQDVKNGRLRFVDNVFPFKGYPWNYGAFPQTWENGAIPSLEGTLGDNDPLDVCELGSRVATPGSVIQVRVLGILGLLDEGETDWKVMAIDVTDPLADQLHSLEDVERLKPGYLGATRDWFRLYKIPVGKAANRFAFSGEYRDAEFSLNILRETHLQWRALVEGRVQTKNMALQNLSIKNSAHHIIGGGAEAEKLLSSAAPATATESVVGATEQDVEPRVQNWYFVGKATSRL